MNSFHGTFTAAFTTGNMLKNLNLNGNHIEGQVLFHGHIDAFKTKSKVPFTKLRIIDISYNELSGLWPTSYIEKFEAMMNMDEHAMKLKYMGDIYYYDYVVVIMKGHEIKFSRISTIISVIDLSSNKFIGEISKSIGRLNSLQDLNLSHNNLKGHIPTSLGNLKNLESLDLSSNKLTSLMFLVY
ncbi:receptor-like protein 43 [Camellia sinensis]|uniref:receptor-like protein 43 n=1 Tax=Camellia sinensis TaxID=4442 RepID=UPI0010361306|nr:receptor-like protein 43 [Camellia sinensis]